MTVRFKLSEIDQQQIRIENAKTDYSDLQQEFAKVKGSLESNILEKNAEISHRVSDIKARDAEIRKRDSVIKQRESEISIREDKLAIGDEIFRKVFVSSEWNKKLGRTIQGNYYFKNKRSLSFFAKKRDKRFLDDKIKVIESGLFSPFYYLTQNPDIWGAGVDPLNHFNKHGWKEGRNPSKYFDCKVYLKENVDVAKSAKNPLLHYIKYGREEGRSPGVDRVPTTQSLEKEETIAITDANCVALKKVIRNREIPQIQNSSEDILVSIIVLTS